MVDIDGVLSIFGFTQSQHPPGRFLTVDGIVHFISAQAGAQLRELSEDFELRWCSGWEEKANDYLPAVLGLPGPLPFISFERGPSHAGSHWKLAAIEQATAPQRPLAWIDDGFDERCDAWAAGRRSPTLLVATDPAEGLLEHHAVALRRWARALSR
ncbi:MAG: hypothetical protein DLM63_02800 [Solirubrobacterales bacterium]|nr:MAG: hypothetical protein DLM63_02800 [Solirubrobacterales bacterium]